MQRKTVEERDSSRCEYNNIVADVNWLVIFTIIVVNMAVKTLRDATEQKEKEKKIPPTYTHYTMMVCAVYTSQSMMSKTVIARPKCHELHQTTAIIYKNYSVKFIFTSHDSGHFQQ